MIVDDSGLLISNSLRWIRGSLVDPAGSWSVLQHRAAQGLSLSQVFKPKRSKESVLLIYIWYLDYLDILISILDISRYLLLFFSIWFYSVFGRVSTLSDFAEQNRPIWSHVGRGNWLVRSLPPRLRWEDLQLGDESGVQKGSHWVPDKSGHEQKHLMGAAKYDWSDSREM